MRFTDNDDSIGIVLKVTEAKMLTKAMKILKKISRVPCPEQGLAGEATETIEMLLASLLPEMNQNKEDE